MKVPFDQVPAHLRSTYAMIIRTFPERLPDEDYLPLLAVLAESMSQRAVAKTVALCGFDKSYIVVLNDVRGVLYQIPLIMTYVPIACVRST